MVEVENEIDAHPSTTSKEISMNILQACLLYLESVKFISISRADIQINQ